MDRLALRVHEGEGFAEGLWRREPLEGGAGWGCGEDDEELGEVRERDGEGLALDGVGGGGERERERGEGLGVEDGGDGERAGIEGDGAGVWGGEREEGRGEDCGGGEIKVEREGDVGGEGMGGVGEGVRVDGRHWRRSERVRVAGEIERVSSYVSCRLRAF